MDQSDVLGVYGFELSYSSESPAPSFSSKISSRELLRLWLRKQNPKA